MAARKKRKYKDHVPNDLKDYIFSLGKFIHLYSVAESRWHEAFRGIARIPESVARAMVGGIRGGDLIAMTRRVAKTKRMNNDDFSELEILAEQFNVITGFRDRVVHRQAEVGEKIIYSTNRSSAKSKEDFEYIEFTIDDLQKASMDLASIEYRLIQFIPKRSLLPIPYSPDWFFEPWRYKRLELQTPHRPQMTKKPQVRAHPRRASQK